MNKKGLYFMDSDAKTIRHFVITTLFVCLAMPAIFPIHAFGYEVVIWGNQKTPAIPLTDCTSSAGMRQKAI